MAAIVFRGPTAPAMETLSSSERKPVKLPAAGIRPTLLTGEPQRDSLPSEAVSAPTRWTKMNKTERMRLSS
jgi:hypothetical protein